MKKRYILMGFAGLLAITTAIGGTMAAFQTRTEKKGVSVITTEDLKIDFISDGKKTGNYESPNLAKLCISPEMDYCMPGTAITSDNVKGVILPLKIINEDYSGYYAYVRVRIYKTWLDQEEKSSFLNKLGSKLENRQPDKLEVMSLPNNGNGGVILSGWNEEDGNWIEADDNDEENITLYYKKKLAPGEITSTFLNRIAFSERLNNYFADKKVQFDIEADAVQALPDDSINKAAIASAWGMNATFTSDNEISSISD